MRGIRRTCTRRKGRESQECRERHTHAYRQERLTRAIDKRTHKTDRQASKHSTRETDRETRERKKEKIREKKRKTDKDRDRNNRKGDNMAPNPWLEPCFPAYTVFHVYYQQAPFQNVNP